MSNIMDATVNTFLYKIIAFFLSNDGLFGEISIPTGRLATISLCSAIP